MNDEARMTNDELMTKHEALLAAGSAVLSGICHSEFGFHSSFVIRHSSFPMGLFSILKALFGKPVPGPTPSPAPGSSSTPARQPAAKREAPAPRKLNLDVGQFAPLSDADLKKKARGLGSLRGNPWFGRRDLIPPVSDERTLLVDRALVTHGLLTPEQLAEIHEVGQQMDKVRPDLALAREAANATVARDKEEREAIKQQKKAEAAERKKRHGGRQ